MISRIYTRYNKASTGRPRTVLSVVPVEGSPRISENEDRVVQRRRGSKNNRYFNREKEVDPAWKKAAIMLWKQIADHKHASKFMNPVTDEIANKYSTVIKGTHSNF